MSPKFQSQMEEAPLTEIQRLIRLKRFECPPEDAVGDFLIEFQHRQRSQALTGSSRRLLFERVATYMSSFGKQKWIYAALGGYACVMLFFLVRPSDSPMGQPAGGGGGATPVDAKLKPLIEMPTYDPKLNRVRPLLTEEPEVRVF